MARLVYQNTAAPDFSSSLAGIGQMGRLLQGAAESSNNLFAGLQAQRQAAADRVLAERALAFQDPAALSAALADGSLVGDQAGRASAAGLTSVGNRVGALTTQGANLDALTTSRTNAALREAAKDHSAQYLNSAASGNAAAAQSNWVGGILDLPIADQIELAKAGQGLIGGNLSNQRSDFGLMTDRATERRADQLAEASNRIFRGSYDGASALARFGREQGLDPRVEASLRQGLAPVYPQQFNPGAQLADAVGNGFRGGSAGGGGGGGGSSALSVMTGGAQLPDSIRTIGDMVDNKSALLGSNPRGTATGMYQITSDTWADFAPRALGANWRNADIRSPQVQDQVASAIWDSAKGSAERIKGRWDSLTPQQAQRMVGMPWEQVRDVISQGESSTNASGILANPLAAADAQADIQRADTMANANSSNRAIEALANSTESRAEAAGRLTGENGPFQGYARGEIATQLRRIESEAKVTPAQAARILEDSLTGRGAAVQAVRSGLNPMNWFNATSVRNSIPENTWDNALIQAGIDGVAQIRQDGSANRDRAMTNAAVGQVSQRAQALSSQIRQVRARAAQLQSKELYNEAERLQAQLDKLNTTGDALAGIQQGTQRYTATDLEAPARRAAEERRAAELIDGSRVPNVENMTPLEWSLYSRGLLPDLYFQN